MRQKPKQVRRYACGNFDNGTRLTSRNKTNRAAQAATFELVGCAAHNLILSSWLARRLEEITFDRSASNPVGEIRRSRGGDVTIERRRRHTEAVRNFL